MPGQGIANRIGGSLLPFMNPRVVSPPGTPGIHGRVNVVVATPMRSGTHLMIDLLLNNIAVYRTKPLYVDLDATLKQSVPGRDLIRHLSPMAGHILKTHLPIDSAQGAASNPDLLRIIESAVIVTVHRDQAAVMTSLSRWDRTPEELRVYEREHEAFWKFWSHRGNVALEFTDLLDATAMRDALERIAELTGSRVARRVTMPVPGARRRRIYVNKGLTRVLGRRAPRIDTTIHTLKA